MAISWGLGWKRPSEVFHLLLDYGELDDDPSLSRELPLSPHSSPPHPRISSAGELGFRIDLDWLAGDDEDQIALRIQSQLMVALPPPQDSVVLNLYPNANADADGDLDDGVTVDMKIVTRREPLRSIRMYRTAGSGQQSDGVGVLTRLLRSDLAPAGSGESVLELAEHWKGVTVLDLSGCGLSVLPVELTKLPQLERLYLDNNKLSLLPPELGQLKRLKILNVDNNMLVSVPAELRQCVALVELSLEHNKLVRPLLDFRAMPELCVLRLFGNPLEFLPEILPLHNLRHLSLANIRIEATENIKTINIQIETDTSSSYFIASRHKLSAFFTLVFRFSSCHHPLLASALAKLMEDPSNRVAISKEENAVRQLISMISSDDRHVVEQACFALSSLAADTSLAMQLIKSDIMQPIESVLKSVDTEELISVLRVVVTLAFASDSVAQKMLTRDVLKSLKALCAHRNTEVQRLSLYAVGNLAFCLENRRTLAQSESLRELLLRLTMVHDPCVSKAAARALAILGENESLRRAIKGRPVGRQGLRILSMDGGGMKGMATVQILKQIEQGTGKRIHEMFDLIGGTSTGGMLAVALGIKQMTLDQCEEIYKKLGKLVFTEPTPKDEAATWREKLDQLYKSSSQSFRVVVHGSKHSADQFERLLKEMCADEDGDLLIESAVKAIPKVFVVSTLVNVMPAQPFIFRNYQARKGGWRYLDTGQVLIESACSVERVEEALDTLMPLLPEMRYFRFNPVDERCGMELDETDPSVWLKLEAATEEFIQRSSQSFKNLCDILAPRDQNEEKMQEKLKSLNLSKKPTGADLDENSPSLGWRRMVLLVESLYSPDTGKATHHARSLETFCARSGIRLSLTSNSSGFSKPVTAVPTPFTSPLFTGSFPSSPLVYSPEFGPQRINRIDLVPPLSLDGHQFGKVSASPPSSPLASRQPSIPVRSLHEKLQNLPQVGIIHLALQNDLTGAVLSWQNDVFVVAEPGELAERFLQSVKMSLSSMLRSHSRKDVCSLAKVQSVADLVAQWRYFQVGGILHRYIGCQTQVMDDNQEIGAFMFRRTVPATHLTADDVRWMVGAWRDRIIISTGKYGLPPSMVKAFLDSGAKAIISSSVEPPDTEAISFQGSGEYNGLQNGKFVIGDDEAEDEEPPEPTSPISDWEDSDHEKGGGILSMNWMDDDEEELSRFVCVFYDSLFREGNRIDAALQQALRMHPKLRYSCHLP
ncbi:Phospholipase A(1) protein [Dioscorea alata]|uniref:Phospholipase A(1) protein n=1 Tax=Dioscorea alata TaxID=55571 RepID=A0ACB7UNY9_DIOAL|nr:Phospholipase A(1) protein [Dioscorea alata]